MKPEHYKLIRKEKPKRKGKTSKLKSRMLAVAQEWKPITSPQLREAYSTKTEWVRKLIPKLKEESRSALIDPLGKPTS
jgi:predicted HTH transcriptional regulator